MASITAKVIAGRTYYYLRECQRVNGKPKIVKTVYLGTLKKLLGAAPAALPKPVAAAVSSFGGVAALFGLAQQLELVALIDQYIPKRRQGLSVGQYLLLAALNRGRMVALLLDQNASRREGIFVSFFGRPASTSKSLAVLAVRTRTPVVPIFIYRERLGEHRRRPHRGTSIGRDRGPARLRRGWLFP